jgi:hypothetical protein
MHTGRTPSPTSPPTPTPTSVATIPVTILSAVSRAIVEWTAEVYPGKTAHLEVASRDPAARRPHTWQATARLSNGVRLRFTLVVHGDGTAWVTRYARLAGSNAGVGTRVDRIRRPHDPAAGDPPHGWAGRNS